MKRIILIFLFIGFTTQTQAQVLISLLLGDKLNSPNLEFGLEGGFNFSQISDLETSNSLNGFNLGFYFDFRLHENWFLYTGVMVKSKMGVEQLEPNDLMRLNATTFPQEGDYSQVLNYFIVPALAKYKFGNHLYAEAGPYFSLMHNAYVRYTSEADNLEADIREENKDQLNRFDMGLSAGAGYTLMNGRGISLGVRYYYGLLDVYKDISGTSNRSFLLRFSIPVGVGKGQESN